MATDILLENGINELEILEFTVGGNDYGINVAKVDEIISECEIQSVPNSQAYVEGLFRRRGRVYSAINLAQYLNLEARNTRDIFIITNFNQTTVAFRVDEIKMIHHLSWTDIQQADGVMDNGASGIITGVAKMEDRMILILDFEKILFDINPETGIQKGDIEKIERIDNSAHREIPVLIAEDSGLLRQMILDCLHKAGFETITAVPNGQAAWEILNSAKNDRAQLDSMAKIVISDIEMPMMDGMTLTRRIKEDSKLMHIPVIIFSSLINEANSQKCTEVGANAQLSKPDIVRLVGTIEELLRD